MTRRLHIILAAPVLLVSLLAGCISSSESSPAGQILLNQGFESGDLSGWRQELADRSYAAQVVSSPVRSGRYAVRFELHIDDPDESSSRRAELTLPGVLQLEERWYAFSVFLPDGGAEDYAIDPSPEIIAQWHNVPDTDLGEGWTSPPLSLHTTNGRWRIQRWWDDAPVTTNAQMHDKGNFSNHDLGEYSADKGRWTDWVFHVKWGWTAAQNPRLEVYKNGTHVLDQNGLPNTTNDANGPYFKMGIYKWEWKSDPANSITTTRVIYHDSVIIGDGNCTLEDVSPL